MSQHRRMCRAIRELTLLLLSGLGWLALELTTVTDGPFNLPSSPNYLIIALSLVVVPIAFLDLGRKSKPETEEDSVNSKHENRQNDRP